jgi:hypothetical protein
MINIVYRHSILSINIKFFFTSNNPKKYTLFLLRMPEINKNKNISIIYNMTHSKQNILYIVNHKTLTDFEVPILISKGFGVLIVKNLSSLDDRYYSLYLNNYYYDNFLFLDPDIISKMNNVDWYNSKNISREIMNILNKYFDCIFMTLLTTSQITKQLIDEYCGKIYYRFFGREKNYRYNNSVPYISHKLKYIFSYQEIYDFEISNDNYFNANNSFVIPLGLSNNLITKIKNTYKPTINRICFICSKIGICSYYTDIYNNFKDNFKNYDYVILGKNNVITNQYILNDLNDDNYYEEIRKSKLLFYHGTEPRHLHYHPLEAIIIGIPIIFYENSLLTKYLNNSLGKCANVEEAKNKIIRILNNEQDFIKSIIDTQNDILEHLIMMKNENIFDNLLKDLK